jgi:hypothetical protein
MITLQNRFSMEDLIFRIEAILQAHLTGIADGIGTGLFSWVNIPLIPANKPYLLEIKW